MKKDTQDDVLKSAIDIICNPTEVATWLQSREVTLLCTLARREREKRFANMECACGNICREHDGHLVIDGEYICNDCR